MYSFGVLLYEFVAYDVPFAKLSPLQAMAHSSAGGRPQIPSGCPVWFAEIICACWAVDSSGSGD